MDGTDHSPCQQIAKPGRKNRAGKQQKPGPPQGGSQRRESLARWLFDESRPIRSSNWCGRGNHRAAVGVAAFTRLAARRLLQLLQLRRRRVVLAAQDQADVGMRDQTAGWIEYKGIAGA